MRSLFLNMTTLVEAPTQTACLTAEAHIQTARRENEPTRPPPYYGNRFIWDLGCMEDTLGKLACPVCSVGRLTFARDDEGKLVDQQQGMRHKYRLICDCAECEFTLDVESSRVLKTGKVGRPPAEVNSAAVAAAEMSGTRQKSIDLIRR